MCGIAGIISLDRGSIPELEQKLTVMSMLIRHRGPDGEGMWLHPSGAVGFAHRRLAILDPAGGAQPMHAPWSDVVIQNGEIYNYIELRKELGEDLFQTRSDTEVLLHAYTRWGTACLDHLKGMFAFAFWDESEKALFCARDRFGIKPFYYAIINNLFYFASEAKALLPFLPGIETDYQGFREYLTFQFCMNGNTLFKGINELPPGHFLIIKDTQPCLHKYWEIRFKPDFDHTEKHFTEEIRELLVDSVALHLRSDVKMGAYVSGGLDSAVVAALAKRRVNGHLIGFNGKFSAHGEAFDESRYARLLAAHYEFPLYEADITGQDFISNIEKVIYALDYPVAGPGSFSQYMVSKLASTQRKVVLGGQGGDEIFGGYTRYLIAYFEQCIKAAIDDTMHKGNFIVTYESIIPNLKALKPYKPLLQQFWSRGLFEPMDSRYFELINRAPKLGAEIHWELLNGYDPFEAFSGIFNGLNLGRKASYFDAMTNFDLKTLLPALLHVEDRMSMAHGLESRVPLLDHQLVAKACTAPADIKFKHGNMKHLFKNVVEPFIPSALLARTDKMGFPTPLNAWLKGEAREFVQDILSSRAALDRDLIDNRRVLSNLDAEPDYGRKIWGLLCLELWQRAFHDQAQHFKKLLT